MDYALLAATALGAVGLYLMLPRERAPLARLGGLLGAMALAGFFLFLVQTAGHWVGTPAGATTSSATAAAVGQSNTPPIYFYLFAAIMIAGAVAVVCQSRPVYAALYFVLVTLAGAGMFVLLLAEFMAIVLIIIYTGAILVTYVFVIMLASQGSISTGVAAPIYDRRAAGSFTAVVVAFVLVGALLQVLLPTNGTLAVSRAAKNPDKLMLQSQSDVDSSSYSAGANPTNVQVIGVNLYSRYSLSLELAGIILTIALVGAVVIARKNTAETETLGSGGLPVE